MPPTDHTAPPRWSSRPTRRSSISTLPGARLGIHQDGDEPADAPVVTLSLGDSCVFRLAGVDRRTAPFTDIDMRSGDLLVFGGPNRLIHHGVPKVHPDTAPPGLDLPPGRLSITVRETGLP